MDAIKHYHPVVGFSFFLLMIVLSLTSMHPVFQVVSFTAAVCYAIIVSGFRSFLRGNWWIFLLIAIVALFNSVFGGRGLTVITMLNLGFIQTPVTVESLVYGLCMGLMLANVILWFNVLGKLSSMQGVIELFSKLSPTAGMMIARITVFMPEILTHAKQVDKAQSTFKKDKQASLAFADVPGEPSASSAVQPGEPNSSSAAQSPKDSPIGRSPEQSIKTAHSEELINVSDSPSKLPYREQLVYAGVLSSNLMEWGMEKSLITAQSMVARGYGSRKRTSLRRTRFALRDAVPMALILALGAISFGCVIWANMTYEFYPYLSPLEFWWGYLPFVLLILVPLFLQLEEELAWWRSR